MLTIPTARSQPVITSIIIIETAVRGDNYEWKKYILFVSNSSFGWWDEGLAHENTCLVIEISFWRLIVQWQLSETYSLVTDRKWLLCVCPSGVLALGWQLSKPLRAQGHSFAGAFGHGFASNKYSLLRNSLFHQTLGAVFPKGCFVFQSWWLKSF